MLISQAYADLQNTKVSSMDNKVMQSEPQKLLRDNYDSCQFWIGSEWYDLSSL